MYDVFSVPKSLMSELDREPTNLDVRPVDHSTGAHMM